MEGSTHVSGSNGRNKDEIARIYHEHPGEENIVKDGRVLGLACSRAFGDGRWKWLLDLQEDLKRRFNGPSPLTPKYEVQTTPYITAAPVVTSTEIQLDQAIIHHLGHRWAVGYAIQPTICHPRR